MLITTVMIIRMVARVLFASNKHLAITTVDDRAWYLSQISQIYVENKWQISDMANIKYDKYQVWSPVQKWFPGKTSGQAGRKILGKTQTSWQMISYCTVILGVVRYPIAVWWYILDTDILLQIYPGHSCSIAEISWIAEISQIAEAYKSRAMPNPRQAFHLFIQVNPSEIVLVRIWKSNFETWCSNWFSMFQQPLNFSFFSQVYIVYMTKCWNSFLMEA